MAQINRKYPGKSAGEIYAKVDEIMDGIAREKKLDYKRDPQAKTGSVTKMGVTGAYKVVEEQVTIDLSYPMLVPGSMRRQLEEELERRLDKLFA